MIYFSIKIYILFFLILSLQFLRGSRLRPRLLPTPFGALLHRPPGLRGAVRGDAAHQGGVRGDAGVPAQELRADEEGVQVRGGLPARIREDIKAGKEVILNCQGKLI